MTVKADKMKQAALGGFINATDLADYLTKKGVPFRTAYKIAGQLVARCIAEHTTLDALPLKTYLEYSDLFGDDIYTDIDLQTCVEKRISEGGTSLSSVLAQIEYIKETVNHF